MIRLAMRFLAKKPRVAFGLPYLLIELFYIGMPVVRTDGRKDGRTVTWRQVTSKSSRMHKDNQIFLPKVLRYKKGSKTSRKKSALVFFIKVTYYNAYSLA